MPDFHDSPEIDELTQHGRYGLEAARRKGRNDGRNGIPRADATRPSSFEIALEPFYKSNYDDRRETANGGVLDLENQIDQDLFRTDNARENTGTVPGDVVAAVEQGLDGMDAKVQDNEEELNDLRSRAQDAWDAVGRFREGNDIGRPPMPPESRSMSFGVILGVLVLETMINGVFFGHNVQGAFLGGMSEAVLYSAFNVLGLAGLAGGVFYRYAAIRQQLPKMGAYLGVSLMALGSLLFNLFVAHYRDALDENYPVEGSGCFRGIEEAGQEALCLFTTSRFGLAEFESYVLMLLGISFFTLAAWEWWKMDDPYPGYGRLERIKRKLDQALRDEKQRVMDEIQEPYEVAVVKLEQARRRYVARRDYAINVTRDRGSLWDRHKKCAERIRECYERVVKIYRASNEDNRRDKEPPPEDWSSPFEADWEPWPDLEEISLISLAEAEERDRKQDAVVSEHRGRLDGRRRECRDKVQGMTGIDPY